MFADDVSDNESIYLVRRYNNLCLDKRLRVYWRRCVAVSRVQCQGQDVRSTLCYSLMLDIIEHEQPSVGKLRGNRVLVKLISSHILLLSNHSVHFYVLGALRYT